MSDVIASLVHLNMKYDNNLGHLVLVKVNLHGAKIIYETTLKRSLACTVIPEEIRKDLGEITSRVDVDL